jgi:type VI secretion system protein ImpA
MALPEITLLPDISESEPAGENLEFDPDFVAMERASEGTPETQYGDTVNPEIPPDWKEVESLASGLQERTRDLRVMALLAMARLNLYGAPRFAEVLVQIRNQIENRWDQVHPRLDPEDDNDPTLRANSLVRLQDPRKMLRPLRDLPLARTPLTGAISWRDIAVATGQMEPEPGHEKQTETFLRGVFNATDRERLQDIRDGFELALSESHAISRAFEAAAGPALDLTNLTKLLETIVRDLRRFEPSADAAAETLTE